MYPPRGVLKQKTLRPVIFLSIKTLRPVIFLYYKWIEDSSKELLYMEKGLIQWVVIDGVRISTESCYRWSKNSCRERWSENLYLSMCTRYWRRENRRQGKKSICPVILLSKKSSPRGFSGSRKSVCPVIFKRKITLRPVIFLIIKSLRPVIYGVQKKFHPAVSWQAPFLTNFANSLMGSLPGSRQYFAVSSIWWDLCTRVGT